MVFIKCSPGREDDFLNWINKRKDNGGSGCSECRLCERYSILIDRFKKESRLECSRAKIKYCSAFSGYFDFMLVLTAPITPAVESFTLICIRNNEELKDVVKETQTVVGSIIVDFDEKTKECLDVPLVCSGETKTD